jgi:hypothetical protein
VATRSRKPVQRKEPTDAYKQVLPKLMKESEKLYDFDGKWAQTYKKKCVCGKTVEVSTQEDSYPEYHSDVFVRCACGESVGFNLPVN